MNKKTVLIVLLIVLFAAAVQYSHAAVIYVTTFKDNVPGSLRAAITAANINGKDNIIYLSSGTYLLTGGSGEDNNVNGDLDINTGYKLTIIGKGNSYTFIDGNGVDRVFHILNGKVTISDLTVMKGKTLDGVPWYGGDADHGGGIYNLGNLVLNRVSIKGNRTGHGGFGLFWYGGDGGNGGGIYNLGTLTLNNCLITYNRTGDGGEGEDCIENFCGNGGHGGGVYSEGALVLNDCSVSYNNTGDSGTTSEPGNCSGNAGDGGGIYNNGTQTITRCKIFSNSTGNAPASMENEWGRSGHGGGICTVNGTSIITYSSISSNKTGFSENEQGSGYGGGVFNSASLIMSGCTLNNNITGTAMNGNGGFGGGIFNMTDLTMINSTISGNETGPGIKYISDYDGIYFWLLGGSGGGMYNYGNMDLTGVTIVNNRTNRIYGNAEAGYGGGIFNSGFIRLRNSILANNKIPLTGQGPDCFGSIDKARYNLIKNIDQCTFPGIQTNNIFGKDPMLGPLKNDGGYTKTHMLLPGSRAIDAGFSFGLTSDQRGNSRPVDFFGVVNVADGADIGAYESASPYSNF